MKKVAIVQSNYIPWKGYFDLIAHVDEFILYDDVQFTKNDWRNRNRIKTPKGGEWLSIPVGPAINRRIRDVTLPNNGWGERHWRSLDANYRKAAHFSEIAAMIEPVYRGALPDRLSDLNRKLIELICGYLGIATHIRASWDYPCEDGAGKSDRIVSLCRQAGASAYISGPAARAYLDERTFARTGIDVHWFNYDGYRPYPQLWGPFVHEVTILDLMFNCGKDAPSYMKIAS